MQATYEEQQNTLGWFRARLGNITGSAVGNLMGNARSKSAEWSSTAESYIQQLAFERAMDSDIVNNDMLFAQYIELTETKSKAIQWGHKQEANAAELFAVNFQPLYEPNAGYFELQLEEPPSVKSKELPHFASSPDRMFANPVTGEECCVEIKSPQGKAFAKYAAITLLPTLDEKLEALKKAEPNYYWQIFAHMLATGTGKCYWVIFNPFSTNPLYTMEVARDEDIINELREKIVKADQYIEQFVARLKHNG